MAKVGEVVARRRGHRLGAVVEAAAEKTHAQQGERCEGGSRPDEPSVTAGRQSARNGAVPARVSGASTGAGEETTRFAKASRGDMAAAFMQQLSARSALRMPDAAAVAAQCNSGRQRCLAMPLARCCAQTRAIQLRAARS